MTQENSTPTYTVRLQGGTPGGSLIAKFQYAPETPAVGQPGAQAGDLLVTPNGGTGHTVIVSLGKREKVTPEVIRKAGGALGKWLIDSGAADLEVDLSGLDGVEGAPQAALEGLKLGAYRFGRYKQAEKPAPELTITVTGAGEDLIDRVERLTDAVIFARDLAHEPANVINPITLAERAQAIALKYGLDFKVFDEKMLAEMGAGAILAVGKGSRTPPRLIVLEYPGVNADGQQPVVLVGKAITFDTGGYSIKGTEGIVGMKYDKCGGVDVLATMQAAAELKIKTPLVGIISAAENMISGEAYRPDDIIRTLNGKTVEIISTDAEGRLVLADALTYAQENYNARAVIDMATLTGGVVVALGRVRAGLLSNNDALADALFRAGEATGERLWRLPLDEEYSRNMRGDDADLKNSGGREGHCILGGAFLKAFVDDEVPWAHLDIAGVADANKEGPYAPKGATGFGVRLLIQYLEQL